MYNLRLIRILLLFSISAVVYSYLGLKVIIRKNDKYSRYLSAFYFSQLLVFIINIVYAFIFVDYIVYYMYLALLYIGSIGFGFLLIFYGMIFFEKHEYFHKWKSQACYILIYAVVLLGIFLIPENVVINEGSDWKPVYSFHFMLYMIIVNLIMAGVPLTIISIKTYTSMKAPEIKRKYLSFWIALYLYFFVLIATIILNFLNMNSLNLLYFVIGSVMLPSAYLMYYGLKMKIKINLN